MRNAKALFVLVSLAGSLSIAVAQASDTDGQLSRGMSLGDLLDAFKKTPTAAVAAPKAMQPKVASAVRDAHSVAAVSHRAIGPDAAAGATATQRAARQKTMPSGADTQVSLASSDSDVVSATLDKPGKRPTYRTGEEMIVTVKAKKDCKVIVFDYDTHGMLTQLFPNRFVSNNTVKAGDSVKIGGQESGYMLGVGGKGLERIFVYAYPMSIDENTATAMAPVDNSPFRSMNLAFEQYRQLVTGSRQFDFGANKTAGAATPDRSVAVMDRPESNTTRAMVIGDQDRSNKLELTFQIDN